jgi:hypothetical protein
VSEQRPKQLTGTRISERGEGVGSIELWDEEIDEPAAGLRVWVTFGGRRVVGVTNSRGVVSVAVPEGEPFQIEVINVHKLEQVVAGAASGDGGIPT